MSQLTTSGATGYFVEYSGDVVKDMSMEGRLTPKCPLAGTNFLQYLCCAIQKEKEKYKHLKITDKMKSMSMRSSWEICR